MRLIAKIIRISRAKRHCNRLTTVQGIQITRVSFLGHIVLTVPRHNLSLSSRAFRIFPPTTWNSLPQNVRECSSLASFWNHLKTHYFSSAFSAL